MGRFQAHVRNKLVAGTLAAVPVAVTALILWYLDAKTRALFDTRYPLVGLAATVVGLYVLGLFITSLVGRWLLTGTDLLLGNIPGLRALYQSWKQMAFSPSGAEGIFARVLLVPDETGRMKMLAFAARRPIEGDPETLCVFVPGSPNPTTGRLYFVPASECVTLEVPAREAFKVLISGGNYVPGQIGRQLAARRSAPPVLGGPGTSGHAGEP